MKKFKVVIIVETDDEFHGSDFALYDHDVIDGFELSRKGDDLTSNFCLQSAYIEEVIDLKS